MFNKTISLKQLYLGDLNILKIGIWANPHPLQYIW